MTRRQKIKLGASLLSVIGILAVVPAAQGLAATEPKPEAGPAACTAIADDLLATVTGLTDGIGAVPPDLSTVPQLLNELLGLGTTLIDLSCLPAPELPLELPQAAEHTEQLPLPIDPTLPTVPECTDLTADLLDAITGVLASLLSTGLPDLAGALSAITGLLDTLTGLTDASCLPAVPAAS